MLHTSVEGDRRGDLHRLEHAVVEIALQLDKRLDDRGIAEQERAAPAGHREALRHRVQLDRALLGTLGLEDARRPVAVEADVGIREVVDDDHLPLPAEVDDPLHEVEVDDGPRRVVRERDDEHPRLGPTDVIGGREPVEELLGELPALILVGE
jgi:hypothetical protein